MAAREQLVTTFVRAYYPAWSIARKENAGERMATTDVRGGRRARDEWDKRAGYPFLLCEHRFFRFFLLGQLKRPT